MVKCGPKIEFLNLDESKNTQKVYSNFFKTMNLKVLSNLVLNFLMIKSALHVFGSL